jgi:hypothetical protein
MTRPLCGLDDTTLVGVIDRDDPFGLGYGCPACVAAGRPTPHPQVVIVNPPRGARS